MIKIKNPMIIAFFFPTRYKLAPIVVENNSLEILYIDATILNYSESIPRLISRE